jgi:hypothetical protein
MQLQIPDLPPEEYDLRLVVERKSRPENMFIGLVVSVDGKKIFDRKGDFKSSSLGPSIGQVAHTSVLYLKTYDCIYRFTRLVLMPVSGTGKRLR